MTAYALWTAVLVVGVAMGLGIGWGHRQESSRPWVPVAMHGFYGFIVAATVAIPVVLGAYVLGLAA